MKKILLIAFLNLIFLFSSLLSAEDITLSRFLYLAMTNKSNLKLIEIEQAYQTVVADYEKDLAKYGFSLTYAVSKSQSWDLNLNPGADSSNTATLSGSKQMPFLFGQDISLSYSQTYPVSGYLWPSALIPQSQSISTSYTLPLTPEALESKIYTGAKLNRDLAQAKLTYISSLEIYARELITKFSSYIDARERYQNTQTQNQNQGKLLKLAETKYNLGQISGYDLIKTKIARLRDADNFRQAKQNYDNLKIELAELLGDKNIDLASLKPVIDFDLKVQPLAFYLARLPYNKTYLTSIYTLGDARAAYLEALVANVPDLSLSFSKSLATASSAESGSYSMSGSLSIPILDNGSYATEYKSKQTAYEQAKLAFADGTRLVHNEIIAAYNKITQLQESKTVLDLNYKYAKDAYEIAYDQFNKNPKTIKDVQDAIKDLESVQDKILSNRQNRLLALFDLKIKASLFIPTEYYFELEDKSLLPEQD